MLSKSILKSAVPLAAVAMLAGCGGASTTSSFNGFTGYDVWGANLADLNAESQGIFADFENLNGNAGTGSNPDTNGATFNSNWQGGTGGVLFQIGTTSYAGDLTLIYANNVIDGDINTIGRDNEDGSYTASTGFIEINPRTILGGQFNNAVLVGTAGGDFDGLNGQMDGVIVQGGDTSILVVFEGSMSGMAVDGIGSAPCISGADC